MIRSTIWVLLGLGIVIGMGCGSAPPKASTSNETPQAAEVTVEKTDGEKTAESGDEQTETNGQGFQQAIAACSTLKEGAQCAFETPRGQNSGTCAKSPRDEQQLVCRSVDEAGKHGSPKPRAPEAAFKTCGSKAAGDACSYMEEDNEVAGKCVEAKDKRLVCHPEGKKGPGKHDKAAKCDKCDKAAKCNKCDKAAKGDKAAKAAKSEKKGKRGNVRVQACADQSEGASCTFEGPKRTITGICKKGKVNRLICTLDATKKNAPKKQAKDKPKAEKEQAD